MSSLQGVLNYYVFTLVREICNVNTKSQYYVCFTVLPPDAPKPPVVTEVHATSCTVTYQPPERDGGAPLSYILERRTPGPYSKWIRVNYTPVTELHYTIDNLSPATKYEFRVAAVNKKNSGNFSTASRILYQSYLSGRLW